MRKAFVLALSLLAVPLLAARPKVQLTTSMGAIVLELEPDVTPATVKNFVAYVGKKHYDGTVIHRVAKSPAVIQGGGHLPDMTRKEAKDTVKNEADLAKAKGLLNKRGTIAMARSSLPDSASSQFFINTKDNPALDFKARNLADFGYCVFGKVVKGMDVVDKISKVPVKGEQPVKPVVITSAAEIR